METRLNMRKWARFACVCVWIVMFLGLLQQCISAQSSLRNSEWKTKRVSTPLLLTQPKTGMHGEAGRDTVGPRMFRCTGCPRATHATHPNAFPFTCCQGKRKGKQRQAVMLHTTYEQECKSRTEHALWLFTLPWKSSKPDSVYCIYKLNACWVCHMLQLIISWY